MYHTNKLKTIFWCSFGFLFLIWFLNLSQYFVILAFALFILFLFYYLKNITLALLIVSILGFCIDTGKAYTFLLLPPGSVSPERFPYGYSIGVSFTINQIIAVVLLAFIIHGFVTRRFAARKVILLDLLVLIFYLISLISAFFASVMPEVSIIIVLLSFSILIKYLFFRLNQDVVKYNRNFLLASLGGILFFEGVVSFIQFINSSPIARSIEIQKTIEVFGVGATDEVGFVFRPLGTFVHANYLAAFIVLLSPLVLVNGLLGNGTLYYWVYFFALLVSGLTLSRIGWAALIPQFIIFCSSFKSLFRKIIKKLNFVSKFILICLFFSFFFLVFFQRFIKSFDVSSSDINNGLGVRVAQIENAFKLIKLHPLLGVGSGMSVLEGYRIEPTGVMWSFPDPVHNIFILIMVENGFVALVLYLMIFGYLIYNVCSFLKRRDLGEERLLLKGLLSGLLGIVIVGLVQPYDFLEIILILSVVLI